MPINDATPHAGPESEFLWLRDGSLPHSREDRVTEVLALIALLFSLSVGLVIAMLPVSAKAAAATQASLEPSGLRIVPTADRHPARRARTSRAG
jgi:hypothetical protein